MVGTGLSRSNNDHARYVAHRNLAVLSAFHPLLCSAFDRLLVAAGMRLHMEDRKGRDITSIGELMRASKRSVRQGGLSYGEERQYSAFLFGRSFLCLGQPVLDGGQGDTSCTMLDENQHTALPVLLKKDPLSSRTHMVMKGRVYLGCIKGITSDDKEGT
jgi:hypothetical protein